MNKVPIVLKKIHKQKVSHYPTVLEYMNKQITRHAYGTPKENLIRIMNKVPILLNIFHKQKVSHYPTVLEYTRDVFYVRREVDLKKTAKVNAYIMHIFGKIEL